MHEEGPPRCLKSWSPHEGKPLSSLLWLDDHTNPSPDSRFWKFVITGCTANSELKVWCSSSWTCLQTIKFKRPESDEDLGVRLKAVLDPTAQFLVLSDIDARLIFVLNIVQTETRAEVISVGEFASPTAVLSLSCESAGLRTVKQTTEGMEVVTEEEDLEDLEPEEKTEKTVVKLFFVQPKSLQECYIIFDNAATGSLSVSLTSADVNTGAPAPVMESQTSPTTAPVSAPPPVLTPLKSPVPPAPMGSSSPRSQLPLLPTIPGLAEAASKISLLSPDQFQSAPVPVKKEPVLNIKQEPIFSGHSSPESREVADILDDCVEFKTEESNDENEEEEEEEPVTKFRDLKITPPSAVKFPTPPSPPSINNNATSLSTSTVVVNTDDMERRLEALIQSKMDRLESRSRKDNQALMERMDDLFVTLSSNVNRKVEETVTSEIRKTLPLVVKKGMDVLEKDLTHKLSGIDVRVAKELSSGQSKDLIGRAVANSMIQLVETSYKQAFANQVTGMERAFGAMLRQINEQFLAGTREYEGALAR